MRVQSLEVTNYKGIAHAKLEDLGTEGIVMVSGRNGTGKSLLLEALVSAWMGRYDLASRTGPWGDRMTIEIEVAFTPEEFQQINTWHVKETGVEAEPKNSYWVRAHGTSTGGYGTDVDDLVLSIARRDQFRQQHPFATIDFLSASRVLPINPSPTLNLGMLNPEQADGARLAMLDQVIQQRSVMNLPNVSDYLVSLDYQALLAEREGLPVENEYERLADVFAEATGKSMLAPRRSSAFGSVVEVQLGSGHTHSLRELSSGEQEMLALLYFVRRLSASGGILCLDEPEQHLHPSLQAALFDGMRDMADRAQMFVVSHSVNLISAADLSGLVQIEAGSDMETNQAIRVRDGSERADLMTVLGITAADLLQSDMIVVVEGPTDARFLKSLLPIEFGRIHIVSAGSGGQVVDAHDTLTKVPFGAPWLCICDRDLRSDSEVSDLTAERPNLLVWPVREIESLLLDAALLAATLSAAGRETSEADAQTALEEAAAPLKEDVLEELVRSELSRLFPPPSAPSGSRWDRVAAHYRDYAQVNSARAEAVNEVLERQRSDLEERWPADWPALVDPKVALRRLSDAVGTFRNSSALTDALLAKARDDASVRPAFTDEVRRRLEEALASTVTTAGPGSAS